MGPGDGVVITGPSAGGAYHPDPAAAWFVLAGDAAALPAVATILDALRPSVRAEVVLEVEDEREEQPLTSPADVRITWLHRGPDGDAPSRKLAAGLRTMIGCMIETSILITAAAHLAELTDYLDIDGNLLITNDPYRGATALVTGGASGIGAALARALAARGAYVAIADRQVDAARAMATRLAEIGAGASAHELDVRDPAAAHALVADLWERRGGIDFVFANAGTGVGGEALEYTDDDWRYIVDERGTWTASGDQLTVSPTVVTGVVRDLAGNVKKKGGPAPEKVTYRFQTTYFSGLKETQLVLTPPKATDRDGAFASNPSFSGSYLMRSSADYQPAFRFAPAK